MSRIMGILVIVLYLSGCAAVAGSVQSLGGGILQFVGLMPGASAVSSVQGLLESTEQVTREQEYYLGRGVSTHILSTYTVASETELQNYLSRVGAVVAAADDGPAVFGGYHFILLNSADVNAISAPGGFVFITRGMIDILGDEDALAAVLAHEVAHVSGRHGLRALDRNKLTETLNDLGAAAGSLSCNQVLSNATIFFGATIDDIVTTLVDSGYSRELEFEADAHAISILKRSGYDPAALDEALALLEVVEERSTERQSGWLKTHPPATERRSKIDASSIQTAPSEAELAYRAIRRNRFKQAMAS